MQRRLGFLIAFLLVSVLAVPVAAQTPTPLEFNSQYDPVSLVGSYYNAITLGDYHRAYTYWQSAPGGVSEARFAQGFSDTTNVYTLVRLPIIEDAGAGNVYAAVPTLVTATHRDGTTVTYAGCFITHRTNVPVGNATEPDPNWYLQSGRLKQQSSYNLAALDDACSQFTSGSAVQPSQLNPILTVQSYFTDLATGGIITTYWEDPSADLVYQTYGKELIHQLSLDIQVNPVVIQEGAAGSTYATVAALITLNAPDNNKSYLTACFTLRKSNVPVGNATEPDPNWRFTNVVVNGLDTNVMDAFNKTFFSCSV